MDEPVLMPQVSYWIALLFSITRVGWRENVVAWSCETFGKGIAAGNSYVGWIYR
jgi:hypothetical protein